MQPPQSIEEIKAGLETTEKGGVRQSIRNCLTVFQRDPLLSGAIAYNILTDRKDIMVNAMYAKDISKKIWTSLQRKKEAGYAVGNDAPYVQNPVYRAKGEIMSLTDKVSQMAKKREQLYADYVAGVVDSEDYQLIREDYSRQYDGLRAALQEAENKKVQVEQQIEEYLNMTSHLEEHLDNFEFDIKVQRWAWM